MTDTFRKEYKDLHEAVKEHIKNIKIYAEDLENILNKTEAICEYDKRCMALAKTNLEQAIMWAVKAIT